MALVDLSATQAANLLDASQLEDLIKDDLLFRDKQLQRLRDEILDLEDLDDSVSLTDFSLDEFRLDLLRFLEATLSELEGSPEGLYAVVGPSDNVPIGRGGALFCLRHRRGEGSADSAAVFSAPDSAGLNPLSPYYLVYVLDDGTVRLTFADSPDSVKTLLDAGKNGTLPREWKALVASDEEYLRRWLYGLQQTIAFLETRKSPPHCIECGGKNIQPISNEKSDMTTLPSGERCTLSQSIASTSICNRLVILSLDGEVLGEIGRYEINGNKIDCQFPYHISMETLEDADIVT